MAHKPGSRKDQVHQCFDKEGPEAALALALKLDLAPGTARSWMNTWAKGKGITLPKAPKAPKAEKSERGNRIGPARRRVYDIGAPDVHGSVIEEGPQVSTVRWDKDDPWGRERHVSNKYLKDVKDPK